MKTRKYWQKWAQKAGIRAVKTMAQTAVAMIPVGMSVSEIGWTALLGTAALAGITSLLTSIAGLPELKGEE
ncbi:MAG: holin [Clostridia bacterium]